MIRGSQRVYLIRLENFIPFSTAWNTKKNQNLKGVKTLKFKVSQRVLKKRAKRRAKANSTQIRESVKTDISNSNQRRWQTEAKFIISAIKEPIMR